MDDVCIAKNGTKVPEAERHVTGGLAAHAEALGRQIVRVEANFLRLPLFTLDSKHMRTMDGIRCEGTFNRSGKSYAFSYAVTRNAATYYPGALARSAHFALLSFATDRGLPIQNPITFSWRELCARIGVQPSGQMVTALREAITATKGLMIESRAALFSKAQDAPISTEDRGHVVGIYDEVAFYGATRTDGSRIDGNTVWLSHWYLENLNALYSGPLDYDLWRGLNATSSIGSRLYEFLFFKFYSGQDLLRFNYPTLVKFIPVRTERYLSQAKKQLQPAFDLLCAAGVLRQVQWVESRGGLPQILFHRGPILTPGDRSDQTFDLGDEDFVLDRIEEVKAPEWQLVEAFHAAWGNADFRPARAELDMARDLIGRHGLDTMKSLLPRLVKRLKVKWTDAKTFNAVARYIPEVMQELECERSRERREQLEEQQRDESRQRTIRQAQDQAVLKAIWEDLSPAEQEEIRAAVLSQQSPIIAKFPGMVDRFSLQELARRKGLAANE